MPPRLDYTEAPPFMVTNLRGRIVAEQRVNCSRLGFEAFVNENGVVRVDHNEFLAFWLEFTLPHDVLEAVRHMLPQQLGVRGRVVVQAPTNAWFSGEPDTVECGHRSQLPVFEAAYPVSHDGTLRLDSRRHPDFWLELDLSAVSNAWLAALYSPDGPAFQAFAAARY